MFIYFFFAPSTQSRLIYVWFSIILLRSILNCIYQWYHCGQCKAVNRLEYWLAHLLFFSSSSNIYCFSVTKTKIYPWNHIRRSELERVQSENFFPFSFCTLFNAIVRLYLSQSAHTDTHIDTYWTKKASSFSKQWQLTAIHRWQIVYVSVCSV